MLSETIKEYDRSADILFIGREGGEENESIKREGFNLKCIKICGIKRKITTENIKNVMIALSSRKKVAEILKEFTPDIVVSTGGYVCWPVISVANRLKIPTIIHESNATPGLVTKILAAKCTRVLLNLSGSERKFKRKDNIRLVGNPSKNSFIAIDKKNARKRLGISDNEFMILSFGGSGGSKVINEAIIEVMKEYSQKEF